MSLSISVLVGTAELSAEARGPLFVTIVVIVVNVDVFV